MKKIWEYKTIMLGVSALLCAELFTGITASAVSQPSVEATSTPAATESASPTATSEPAPTESVSDGNDSVHYKRIHLKKPSGLKVLQVTSTTVTLQWKKVKKAKKYEVYSKKKGASSYKKIAVTKKRTCQVKKLKSKTAYLYKILAFTTDKNGEKVKSSLSKAKQAVTKPKIRKTAYVGDSVMCGMANYLNNRKKGSRVIGKIGISTWNFWRSEYMDKLLSYNPDRIYIMLGVNSLVGSVSSQHCDAVVADYKKIIRLCRKNNPDVDIVILSVAPCTAGCRETSNAYINMYNKKQKAMAKKKGLKYFDFSAEFKDSTGYLKQQYNGGDGLHWSTSGCVRFKQLIKAYDKKLK